jgi:methyl-accepting chemotaxis protein-1 (serine sensor receptor)
MGFRNWSVRTKLVVLLGVMLGALVGMGIFNWYALSRAGERLEAAMKEAAAVEEAVDTTRRAQVDFKVHVQEFKNLLIRGGDAKDFEYYSKALDASGKEVFEQLKKLEPLVKALGIDPEVVQKTVSEQHGLNKRYENALSQYDPDDPKRAQTVDKLVRGVDRAATEHIDNLVKVVRDRGDARELELMTAAVAERKTLVALIISVALLIIAVSLVIGVIIIRSIVTPLRSATELAQRVAQGDLTMRVEATSEDEIGRLMFALGRMNESLATLVAQVREGAEAVTTCFHADCLG